MSLSLGRFLLGLTRPGSIEVVEQQRLLQGGAGSRLATVLEPRGGGAGHGWVALHGLTVTGRHHQGVRRFAAALAAAGAVVVVPEVPAWAELRVTPDDTAPALADGLAYLAARGDVQRQHLAAIGFSVGATWLLHAAAEAALPERLRGVVGIGAYADLGRTVRCRLTGEHEWRGRWQRLQPDPYGRWIVGASILPLLDDADGFGARETREAVAAALASLAREAGRRDAYADLPLFDALKRDLRERLPAPGQALWDLFTPPAGRLPDDLAGARALARALARTALRHQPSLDVRPALAGLRIPVVLLHGRRDTLIPSSELPRLVSYLPRGLPRRAALTGWFTHAKRQPVPSRGLAGPAIALLDTLATLDLMRALVRASG